MKTEIIDNGKQVIAKFSGRLDTAAAVQTAEDVKPLMDKADKEIILDCTELEYIASSGRRILISILKGAKANGSKVVLKNLNDDIKNVFKLTGFINLFEFV